MKIFTHNLSGNNISNNKKQVVSKKKREAAMVNNVSVNISTKHLSL